LIGKKRDEEEEEDEQMREGGLSARFDIADDSEERAATCS
jgi:hypothetical protein